MKPVRAFLIAATLAVALFMAPPALAIRVGGGQSGGGNTGGGQGGGKIVDATAEGAIVNTATGITYTDLQWAVYEAEPGQTIQLGTGDFYILTELVIEDKAGFTLRGQGPDKTRILVNSPTTEVISVSYSSDVTISDVYITHNVAPYDGPSCSAGVIQALDVANLTIQNAELVGSGLLGIWYYAFGENGSLGTLRITDTVIRDNQQSGLIIDGAEFDRLVLRNVQIIDNGGYGMEVYGDEAALARIAVEAKHNIFAGNAQGRMDGSMPRSFENAISSSLRKGIGGGRGNSPQHGGENGGVTDRKPRPGHGRGASIPELAAKYEVDEDTLQELVAENETITVLSEYKDAPEMLAMKLNHLGYINSYRQANGAGAIEFDIAVARLANMHAYDQVLNDYMAHDSQDGTTPWERAELYGLGIWAENIAMPGGVGSCNDMTDTVIMDRMNYSSDMFMAEGPGGGHHDNMLATHHTGVGFGLMCYDGRVMYVEDFR